MRFKRTKRGFTIVELMIATVVFSVVLLVILSGLVQITKSYHKGATTTKAQQAARALVDEISQGIQMTAQPIYSADGPDGPVVSPGDATGLFCIGYTQYTYAIDRQVRDTPSANPADKQIRNAILRQDNSSTCTDTTPKADLTQIVSSSSANNLKSLLGTNMRLSKFVVNPIDAQGQLWQIDISIVYGDLDLIVNENGRIVCRSGAATEFCAFSEISTIVKRRMGGTN